MAVKRVQRKPGKIAQAEPDASFSECSGDDSREPSGATDQAGASKKIVTATGEEIEIPKIHGDGVEEIRQMRGEMLRCNIFKALEGSHMHMRVLLEYAGLWPAGAQESPNKADDFSLAALLLEKLETGPDGYEKGERSPSK